MAFEELVKSGKSTLIYLYLGDDSEAVPAEIDFTALAATRGFTRDMEWETRDTTSRDSGSYRSMAATFIGGSGSIDGLTVINDSFQREVERYIRNPSASSANTGGSPHGWLRTVERAPGTGVNDGEQVDLETAYPVLLSSFNRDDPYEDNSTWTINFSVVGDPVETEVPDAP